MRARFGFNRSNAMQTQSIDTGLPIDWIELHEKIQHAPWAASQSWLINCVSVGAAPVGPAEVGPARIKRLQRLVGHHRRRSLSTGLGRQ